MNPREISARFLLQSRCLLGLSVLLFLISTPPQLGKVGKAITSGAAAVALGAAWVQRRQYQRYEPLGGVYSQHELATYAKFLQTTTELGTAAVSGMWETVQTQAQVIAPTEQPLLPPPTFDWDRFNTEPDTYAHLAIVGPTGSGKSTLAEALATQLGGITLAIAPHRKPGDFKALGQRVYCGGRNYGTGKDKLVDFQSLLDGTAGRVSVMSVIQALLGEMNRRYQLWDRGEDVGPFVNVIWDEILAAIATCPTTLVGWWLILLREARKVKIRLIVLPQNDRVKSLGMEGQGADRENLSYVRLGKTAIAHAKSLEKSQPGIQALVQSQRRPCLVEDCPAIVPEYNPAMAVPPAQDVAITPTPEPPSNPFANDLNSLLELSEPVVIGRDRDDELLAAIQAFGEGKSEVTARALKQGKRAFREVPTEAINALLEKLAGRGVGTLIGSENGLKWHPPSTGDNSVNSQQ